MRVVICLQIPTISCTGRRTTSLLLNVHRVSKVRQIEIHVAELLAHDPSPFEAETATANLKKYKWSVSDQIPAELMQAGGETLWSEIHKLTNSIWNKEELPDQYESITVQIYNNGDKTDCSNYREILLLSTSTKCYIISFSQCQVLM
jgi:hypothetical protein